MATHAFCFCTSSSTSRLFLQRRLALDVHHHAKRFTIGVDSDTSICRFKRGTLHSLPFLHRHAHASASSSTASPSPSSANSTSIPSATVSVTSPPSDPSSPLSPSTALQRLTALRAELSARGLDAFVIPTADAHNSEYPAPCFARRAYISLFTGSAGTALVTPTNAYLWTDGRYFLQAGNQLDPQCWTLMRAGLKDTPTLSEFLQHNFTKGDIVGIDPYVHSIDAATSMRDALQKSDAQLVSVDVAANGNPIDVVWLADDDHARPPLPVEPVRVHPLKFAGMTVAEKLASLREALEKRRCDGMLLSMLDEVAWLFNIRGGDIPHCPVTLSYAFVPAKGRAVLYVDDRKLPPDVVAHLQEADVVVRPYVEVRADIEASAKRGEKMWLDPASTSWALSLAAGDKALRQVTPVQVAKAVKNEAELQGMRDAHIRDGVSLCRFLCWLENLVRDGSVISEVDAAKRLEQFRAQAPGFVMTSFDTIAGAGANGAIIHYSPEPGACGNISANEVFLLDSGGQYVDGTTDVTRTMHLGGTPTTHEKACFTRVLRGHIAMDSVVFPEETTGLMLDVLARTPLWNAGLDYRHGTGHGVGACLNVHEGPQSISPRAGSNISELRAGMIVSNEPGYYEDGRFGIRIENLVEVVVRNTEFEFGGRKYLGFDRLTTVPIDKSMVDKTLLNKQEVAWLDGYHEQVWQRLSPHLEEGACREWLWKKTRPL